MNDFLKEVASALTGKDGPFFWGISAITVLTLGWKLLDKEYKAEEDGGKICPSDIGNDVKELIGYEDIRSDNLPTD